MYGVHVSKIRQLIGNALAIRVRVPVALAGGPSSWPCSPREYEYSYCCSPSARP